MYMGNTPVMLGGDLIVGFDGEEIATPQDLTNALISHHPGDVVTITVYRGQRRMAFKVTLSDAKETVNGRSA
jgi:S1-C subfamily serine protease